MATLPNSYPDPVRIGVIGGTGLTDLPHFHKTASLEIDTPWGKPASPIAILEHPSPTTGKPIPIAFLARHGMHHEYAPHEVPARANIAALRSIGVRTIIAFSAVGSLREEIKPRDFVIPDSVIDRTKGIRPFTFFEDGIVCHVPFADAFDPALAALVAKCGHSLEGLNIKLHDGGTLICMEGPQFSTRAESHMYRSWGGSVINMSVLPEAKLAKEAEIAYQMICMSTDYDCWHETAETVTVEMVMNHMKANGKNARRFIAAVLDELSKGSPSSSSGASQAPSGSANGEGEGEYTDLVLAKHLQGQRKFGISTAPAGVGEEAKKRLKFLFPDYEY